MATLRNEGSTGKRWVVADPELWWADSYPSFFEKRDKIRAKFFSWKNAHSGHRSLPQGHCVCVLFAPNKRCKDRLGHQVSNRKVTDPHFFLNILLMHAMTMEEKYCSYHQNAYFKQNSHWRWRREWRALPVPIYTVVRCSSHVIGCCQPMWSVVLNLNECFRPHSAPCRTQFEVPSIGNCRDATPHFHLLVDFKPSDYRLDWFRSDSFCVSWWVWSPCIFY